MTLKELSIELGKPTHVLANTLRQVGLADVLLAENVILNGDQINRLRVLKSSSKKKKSENIDEKEDDTPNISSVYTLRDLAFELKIAEERVWNILRYIHGYKGDGVRSDFPVEEKTRQIILSEENRIDAKAPDYFFTAYDNDDVNYEDFRHKYQLLGLDMAKEPESNSYAKIEGWDDFVKACDEGLLIGARIENVNDGGYLMTAVGNNDIKLFCPYSKAPTWIDKSDAYSMVDLIWIVKKIENESDEESCNTIVSAKLEAKNYEGILKEGGFYPAIVCSCTESGAKVLVGSFCVPAFIPNTYISWENDNKDDSDLKPGNVVFVKIIKNKKEKNPIASIRDADFSPWLYVEKLYPKGKVVDMKVYQQEKKHVVLINNDYKAYLPAEEISWTRFIDDCSEVPLEENVRVVITGYDDRYRTIQVSLRQLEPDPWERIEKYAPMGSKQSALIKSLSTRGAFLEVGEKGFKGYLSYRDVDWCTDVDKDTFPYREGDEVKVKITRCDKLKRKLTCSIKELEANPWLELQDKETILGQIVEVTDKETYVTLCNGINCTCREILSKDIEGQTKEFVIQYVNATAQKITISYRKHEIVELNTSAVGEMFRKYVDEDKELQCFKEDDQDDGMYLFTVDEISSTGRLIASCIGNEENEHFETGILLPTFLTIKGKPVNIIFARYIIKHRMRIGEDYWFRVTHTYKDFPYAVLTFDATELLGLEEISTADLESLKPGKRVLVQVLNAICTSRYIFVHWKGYFGYIPTAEMYIGDLSNLPEFLELSVVSNIEHPEQMIRFAMPDEKENQESEDELNDLFELSKGLDKELEDCFLYVNELPGFTPQTPETYPWPIQLRYDPIKFEELHHLLEKDFAAIIAGTFSMTCTDPSSSKFCKLTIFNSDLIIDAIRKPQEDMDEFCITSVCIAKLGETQTPTSYGRPLKIYGDNIQIVPDNSSAVPPTMQVADVIWELLKYNRKVLPQLRELGRDFRKREGQPYLTLSDLLKMDLKRENALSNGYVTVPSGDYKETSTNFGGIGIAFSANDDKFDTIISKDDSEEGTRVLVKVNDDTSFSIGDKLNPSVSRGRLLRKKQGEWTVEFDRNSDPDIENMKKLGLMIKRNPNVIHITKQIQAIDNFVNEKNGLDIFSKIARKRLEPPKSLNYEPLANPRFKINDPEDSQAKALCMALGGSKISLIQGPPGTGKSTVIVDIICNLVNNGKKVLVCTQSVAPVEELYYKVSGRSEGKQISSPVMVHGHAIRCAYLRDNDSIELSGSVKERIGMMKDMRLFLSDLHKQNKKAESSHSNSDESSKEKTDVVKLQNSQAAERILSQFPETILPAYQAIEETLSEYINALSRKDVEDYYADEQILQKDAIDVVFGTCIGVGVSRILREVRFDTLILDEAGKANYAETLVPMMMANEYILVGDDKQLPPYTNKELVKEMALNNMEEKEHSEEVDINEDETLRMGINSIMENVGQSLFGDLRERLPSAHTTLLTKQFRMHPEIGDFVSKLFYEGKVISIPKAEDRTVNIEGLERPIMFIDTSGLGEKVKETRIGTSLYNDGEIKVIEEELVDKLQAAKRVKRTVGILSPYGAQVMRMREQFKKYGLDKDIFTIDSIQGEEYDIVVFSFVRNTNYGNLNFIDSLNRLNVSFSRAKCNLIMVGHLDTLHNEKLHKEDWDKVKIIYDEIKNKKIELIEVKGALERFYEDFPTTTPMTDNLDEPYFTFEKCYTTSRGNFRSNYKGGSLQLYNPAIETILPKGEFKAHLLGFKDGKPYTMIEPIGAWLKHGLRFGNFRFSATIVDISEDGQITLRLFLDNSLISLQLPPNLHVEKGDEVVVQVSTIKKQLKFTLKPKNI